MMIFRTYSSLVPCILHLQLQKRSVNGPNVNGGNDLKKQLQTFRRNRRKKLFTIQVGIWCLLTKRSVLYYYINVIYLRARFSKFRVVSYLHNCNITADYLGACESAHVWVPPQSQ